MRIVPLGGAARTRTAQGVRLLCLGFEEVLRLPSEVLRCLRFFAPVAFFAALEVIILAFGALPAALRELEGGSLLLPFLLE